MTDKTNIPNPGQPATSIDPKLKTAGADVSGANKESSADKAKEMARDGASTLGAKARDMADAKLEEGKAEATARIERTAEQIRNAGHEFGDDSYQAQAAEYLASNLSQAADMIRGKDLGDLVDDVTHFARRNPALFLGGAALLGFAAARLMKASERTGDSTRFERGSYDRPRYEREQYGRPADDAFGGDRATFEREPYA